VPSATDHEPARVKASFDFSSGDLIVFSIFDSLNYLEKYCPNFNTACFLHFPFCLFAFLSISIFSYSKS